MKRTSRPLRRGMAPLEIVLAAPIAMALLGLILTGACVAANRLHVSIEARRTAWSARYDNPPPPFARLGFGDPIGLGRVAGRPADSGLVTREVHRTIRLPYLFSQTTHTARIKHSVLAGPWDYETIPFPPHPPGQPDPRFLVY